LVQRFVPLQDNFKTEVMVLLTQFLPTDVVVIWKFKLPVPLLASLVQGVPSMALSVIHYSVAQQGTSTL
jgi:hypothetical protein